MVDTIYGEFKTNELVTMIAEGHILGARLRRGIGEIPLVVEIQGVSGGTTFQLDLAFLEAMCLLSIIKGIQLDTGTPFPDDPRAPPFRKPVRRDPKP